MNDEQLESALRELPEANLPPAWRASILATARREAAGSREVRPAWLGYFRAIFGRHPITAGGLAVLWALILLLKIGTPDEPAADRLLARATDRPPMPIVPLREQLRLADALQDESDPQPIRQP